MSRMAGYLSRPCSSGVRLPFRLVLPLLVACLPAVLSAQTTADVDSVPATSPPVIRAVRLERRDIFDPNERHAAKALSDARLLIVLAPWPGDGHPGARDI